MKKIILFLILFTCISTITLYGCQTNHNNDNALVIYALEENYQLWELRDLIDKYKNQYPDKHIILQIGMEKNKDRDSAIQRLNNSILSGNGPDILLLEGLPQEKYVEQGMLEDMSEFIHKQITQQDLFSSIMESYRISGSQYGIPYCFAMINMSALDQNKNLEDLDTLVKFRDYLKQLELPEIPIYENWSYNQIISIIYRLYIAEQEGFLAHISEDQINEYYQVIHDIYQMVDMSEVESAGKTLPTISLLPLGYENFDLVAMGDVQFAFDYIETRENLRDLIAIQQNGYAAALQKNKDNYLCVPSITFGVVKNKKDKQDLITDFLQFSLSENIQEEMDTLPVNRKAMQNLLNGFNTEEIIFESEESTSTLSIDYTRLNYDEVDRWIGVFDKTICAGMTDQKIFKIIMQNAENVITKKMTESDAAQEAYRQITLYQDE